MDDEFVAELKRRLVGIANKKANLGTDSIFEKYRFVLDGEYIGLNTALALYQQIQSSNQAAKTDGCREGSTE